MIPESLGIFNALVYLMLACLAGALCGSIACVVLRLRWSGSVVVQNFGIAAIVVVLAVLPIVFYFYYLRTSVDIAPRAFIVAGMIGPVFRHILRFAWIHWRNGTAAGKL
jgi:hypothetical protein